MSKLQYTLDLFVMNVLNRNTGVTNYLFNISGLREKDRCSTRKRVKNICSVQAIVVYDLSPAIRSPAELILD